MKDFKQITSDVYYKMENYHQISIDIIEQVEDIFNELFDILNKVGNQKELNGKIEELGSLCYSINKVLEVFNPIFETEISDLKDVLTHIEAEMDKLK